MKYEFRPDIRDRAAFEKNFRRKFEVLNHVRLSDGEFRRLLDEIVTPDVFTAAQTLRNRSSFTRDDGKVEQARKIWLVDKAPVVIDKLKEARTALDGFMQSQGLTGKPEDVANLRGDDARVAFIKHFKEVQRLQTQLDQYTDLTPEQEQTIETILPKDDLNAFRGQYLETAQRLR